MAIPDDDEFFADGAPEHEREYGDVHSRENVIHGEFHEHEDDKRKSGVTSGFVCFIGERTFADVLRDWQASHGNQELGDFLKQTHLDIVLTEEDWHKLTATPPALLADLTLAYHMIAIMLRDGVFTSQHIYMQTHAAQWALNNRADSAITRNVNSNIDILRAPGENLKKLRISVAEEIKQKVLEGKLRQASNETTLKISGNVSQEHEFTQRIVAALKKQREDIDETTFIQHLKEGYKRNPDATLYAIQDLLADEPPEMIERWAKTALSEPRQVNAGQIVKFFRMCKGETLSEKFGLATATNFSNMETGLNGGTQSYQLIKQQYGLSGEEARIYATALLPALDLGWLEHQPQSDRPILFCQSMRMYMGMTPEQFEKKLDFTLPNGKKTTNNINAMQRGLSSLSPTNTQKLIRTLQQFQADLPKEEQLFTPAHKDMFEKAIDPKQADRDLDSVLSRIDTIPEHQRAHILLRACRIKAGMSQDELGSSIGVLKATQSLRETNGNTSPEAMKKYIKIFERENEKLPDGKKWFTPYIADLLRGATAPRIRLVLKTAQLGNTLPPQDQPQALREQMLPPSAGLSPAG